MSKVIPRSEVGRPTHEEIARRAYELFLQRGSGPGTENADWLQAEAELLAAAALDAEAAADGAPTPDSPAAAEDAGTGRNGGRRSSGRERGGARRSLRP
jgi:Protein of unknown function (DUF2934)